MPGSKLDGLSKREHLQFLPVAKSVLRQVESRRPLVDYNQRMAEGNYPVNVTVKQDEGGGIAWER
jgi:hypothetical protein